MSATPESFTKGSGWDWGAGTGGLPAPQSVCLSLCQHKVAHSAFAEASSKLGCISSAAGLPLHFFFPQGVDSKAVFKKGGKRIKRLWLKLLFPGI